MNYSVKHTSTTPLIDFKNGNINIVGKSIPTVNLDFFKAFINLVESYSENPEACTVINIDLDYINAYSKKCIMQSFRILERMQRKGYKIKVNWYYDKDDEFMLDLGDIYSSLLDLNINFIEK